MNQIFIATTGLILAGILYGLGKKPKWTSKNNLMNNGISSFENSSISLISKEKPEIILSTIKVSQFENGFIQTPISKLDMINLKKKLFQAIRSSNPEERLNAIKLVSKLNNDFVLPIIIRGLKDSDSRVVCSAAAAVEKFKTAPKASSKNAQLMNRPPRNVALMR